MNEPVAEAPKVEPKAEPKVEPKTLTEGGVTYDEKVTLRVKVVPPQKDLEYLDPVANLWAYRRQTADGLFFGVRGHTVNTTPRKGSVITDAAGNEYEVTSDGSHPVCQVRLTKAAKKP
jgi:hypothetical protein